MIIRIVRYVHPSFWMFHDFSNFTPVKYQRKKAGCDTISTFECFFGCEPWNIRSLYLLIFTVYIISHPGVARTWKCQKHLTRMGILRNTHSICYRMLVMWNIHIKGLLIYASLIGCLFFGLRNFTIPAWQAEAKALKEAQDPSKNESKALGTGCLGQKSSMGYSIVHTTKMAIYINGIMIRSWIRRETS